MPSYLNSHGQQDYLFDNGKETNKPWIYLAGKCSRHKEPQSDKWNFASKVCGRISNPPIFVSSEDINNHNSDHNTSGFDWEKHFGFIANKCDMLLAYIDSPNSYGTIAEIAWFSAKGKPSLVVVGGVCTIEDSGFYVAPGVRTMKKLFGEDISGYGEDEDSRSMHDVYWFVCSFPGVYLINKTMSLDHSVDIVSSLIKSPIEMMFFKELYRRHGMLPVEWTLQSKIGNYRVDFSFESNGTKIVVELDGHDYHKTKEQRTIDAKRDRYLTGNGWQVFRFTGSEIFSDVKKCVDEVASCK